MTADSAIEWTDHTFSPWLGCTPISAACDHCYAAAMARRYGWPDYQAGVPRRRTAPSTWKTPRRWQRQAAANGVRMRVFPSLCDPFDGEVTIGWIDDFIELIASTPDLDWLLLTKRPHLAARYFHDRQGRGKGGVPRNVGLGVTAETQAMADLRIPQLLEIEGPKFRFVSIEPMLGPIDLTRIARKPSGFDREMPGFGNVARFVNNALDGQDGVIMKDDGVNAAAEWWTDAAQLPRLDWIIAGGESGPNARPSHPDWFRALRDQCVAADVAFFFKQWGEYVPCEQGRNGVDSFSVVASDGEHLTGERSITGKPGDDRAEIVARVGKARAGAELDGRHWRQLPPQLQQGQGATA